MPDFRKKNWLDWIHIQEKIFPDGRPERYEWTDINEIVRILRIITMVDSNFHLFYPMGGGWDLDGASTSVEKDCIELDCGGAEILKPARLIYHSFNASLQWNYFRLELLDLPPSGVYDSPNENVYEDFFEELCEIKPGEYIDCDHWYANEYKGRKLPTKARRVTRYFSGSFVIFQKASWYFSRRDTYDGLHNTMTDERFRAYVRSLIDTYRIYQDMVISKN